MRTIISEKRLRAMLEQMLMREANNLLSAGVETFYARPQAVSGIVGSILSGGTDYGQHFESVLIAYLNSLNLNAQDLNPAGSGDLDVEDEPNQKNKNAELADVVFGSAWTGQAFNAADGIEKLSEITLLSAKANKSAKTFLGKTEVSKVRKLASSLLISEDLMNKELTKGQMLRFKVGSANFALNPIVSKENNQVTYDLKICYPKTPNLAIVKLPESVEKIMQQASQSFDSPIFLRVMLPAVWQEMTPGATADSRVTEEDHLGGLKKFVKLFNASKPGANIFSTTLPSQLYNSLPNLKRVQLNQGADKGYIDQITKDVAKLTTLGTTAATLSTEDKNNLVSLTEASQLSSTQFLQMLVDQMIDSLSNTALSNFKEGLAVINSEIPDIIRGRRAMLTALQSDITSATSIPDYKTKKKEQLKNDKIAELVAAPPRGTLKLGKPFGIEPVTKYVRKGTNTPIKRKEAMAMADADLNMKQNQWTELVDILPPKDRTYEQAVTLVAKAKGRKNNPDINANVQAVKQACADQVVNEFITQLLDSNNTELYADFDVTAAVKEINQVLTEIQPDAVQALSENGTVVFSLVDETTFLQGIKRVIEQTYGASQGFAIAFDGDFHRVAMKNTDIMKKLEDSSGQFKDISRVIDISSERMTDFLDPDSGENMIYGIPVQNFDDEIVTFPKETRIGRPDNDQQLTTGMTVRETLRTGKLYKLDNNGTPISEVPSKDVASSYYSFFNKYVQQVEHEELYVQIVLPLTPIRVSNNPIVNSLVNILSASGKTKDEISAILDEQADFNHMAVYSFLSKVLTPFLASVNPIGGRRPIEVYSTGSQPIQPDSFTNEDLNNILSEIDTSLNNLETLTANTDSSDKAAELADFYRTQVSAQDITGKDKQGTATLVVGFELMVKQLEERGITKTQIINMVNNTLNERVTQMTVGMVIIGINVALKLLLSEGKKDPVFLKRAIENLHKGLIEPNLQPIEPKPEKPLNSKAFLNTSNLRDFIDKSQLTRNTLANIELAEKRLYNNILKDIMQAVIKESRLINNLDRLLQSEDENSFSQALMLASSLIQDNTNLEQAREVRSLISKHYNRLVDEYNMLKLDIEDLIDQRKEYYEMTNVSTYGSQRSLAQGFSQATEGYVGIQRIDEELPPLREKLNALETLIQSVINDVFYE